MVKHDIDYSYFRRTKIRILSDWAPPLLVFFAAFGVYIKTMASSVSWGNYSAFAVESGSSVAEAPTLFPLYNFLSRVIGLIPGVSPVFLSNILSAFLTAVSVMVFYLIVKKLSDIHVYQRNIKDLPGYQKLAEINPNLEEIGKPINIEAISSAALTTVPSMAAAFLFALTLPVWMSAVTAGAFSLFLALSLSAVYFAIEGLRLDNLKHLYLGLWLYFLSFACQPILALALAPAFLFLIIRKLSEAKYKAAIFLSLMLLFLVSVSIYFYIPIHTSIEAMQSSGVAGNNAFLGSLSALTNGEPLPTNNIWAEYLLRLKKLTLFVAGQIGWIALGLLLFGLWGTYRASKRIFMFFPLAIIGNLALLLWIGKIDTRSFELVNYPAVLIGIIIAVMTIGLLYLLRLRLQAMPSSVYVAVCLLPLIYAAAYDNYKMADKSELNATQLISERVLQNIPDKSLVIVQDEDLIKPLLFYCHFESNKNKVAVISSDGLRNPEYRKQLRGEYPNLLYPANFDTDIGPNLDNIVSGLCRLNSVQRKVFVQYGVPGIEPSWVKPVGVMFMYAGNYKQTNLDQFAYRNHLQLAEKVFANNSSDPIAVRLIGEWLYGAGNYYKDCGQDNSAWRLYDRALTIDQTSTKMRVQLADQLSREGEFKHALRLISNAMEIDSDDPAILELGSRIEVDLRNSQKIAAAD